MDDEMMLMLNDDGVAHIYDETYDIIIHCESAEEQKKVEKRLMEMSWIPCSEPPKESGTYIVTAYDGINKRVSFVKYQKTLKRWDLTGARSYWRILAYKPLPEPWEGEQTWRNE